MTAQEWIDAAIACGRDPLVVPHPTGRYGLMTSCVDVDWDGDPGQPPEGTGRRSSICFTLWAGCRPGLPRPLWPRRSAQDMLSAAEARMLIAGSVVELELT